MKQKIIIRADGDSQIGLGHVVRCLALAEMLKENYEIHFAIQAPTDAIRKMIAATTPQILSLTPQQDLEVEARHLLDSFTTPEIIIIDGYHFDTAYQRTFKDAGWKVVCIDDLHQIHFVADIVINHSGAVKPASYSKESYTRLCLGAKYALLRPPFLAAARQKDFTRKEAKTLICMGGADPKNNTLDALQKCEQDASVDNVILVLGNAYIHQHALEAFISTTRLNIQVKVDISAQEMVEVMQQCAKAICPPSGTSYEYLSIGGELYLMQTADNQKYIKQYFVENHICFDYQEFPVTDRSKVEKTLLRQSQVFEGKSGENLRKEFLELFRL